MTSLEDVCCGLIKIADEGNRTLIAGLEGQSITIMLRPLIKQYIKRTDIRNKEKERRATAIFTERKVSSKLFCKSSFGYASKNSLIFSLGIFCFSGTV